MLPSNAFLSIYWVLFSCLTLLCQVQGEDSQREQPSIRISCPKGSQAYGSQCYALFKTPKSWFDADRACQKRYSGHLVSVLSGAEAFFVSSLVKSNVISYQHIWMGLHDPTLGQQPNGGGWEWSNSDVMNYFNWERNPSTASDRGYCGSLSQISGFLKWRDYDCDIELPYVCKFKA